MADRQDIRYPAPARPCHGRTAPTQAGRLVGRPMVNGDNFLSAVAFSPDGKLIATADNQVRLFSVTTQRPVGGPLAAGPGSVNDMVFSPNGSMIAVATNAGVTLPAQVTASRTAPDR